MKAVATTLVALACFTGTASAQLPVGGASGPDPTPYGTNDSGGGVLPGIYYYRVQAIDQAGNSATSPESLTFAVVLGLLPVIIGPIHL